MLINQKNKIDNNINKRIQEINKLIENKDTYLISDLIKISHAIDECINITKKKLKM